MTTLPDLPPSPTIPLTDELRAAYEDLNTKLQASIEGTADPGALEVLNSSQSNVSNVLTKDDMYRLHADTALFEALLLQIDDTNDELKTLQDQIAAVATDFNTAAKVLAAIQKVLALIPDA